VCGSPQYAAPEILSEVPYSYPCDIWSLGVVLYALVTGYFPFPEESIQQQFEHIKQAKYN